MVWSPRSTSVQIKQVEVGGRGMVEAAESSPKEKILTVNTDGVGRSLCQDDPSDHSLGRGRGPASGPVEASRKPCVLSPWARLLAINGTAFTLSR